MTPRRPARSAAPAATRHVVPVVSNASDLPGVRGVVTTEDFLAGGRTAGRSRATVVNLSRSLKYLSRGYYVSLLADARGQRVFPAIATIRSLSDGRGLFRTLEEEGVDTADPDEVAAKAETRETTAVFGKTTEKDLQRACHAVFRAVPVPLLEVRFARHEAAWRVVGLAPKPVNRLSAPERRLLVAEIERLRDPDWRPPAKARGKQVSLAVLWDEDDRFAASSAETIDKLERIGARRGVHVHRISLSEISQLGDYDALLIRTLTGLNEPSFRFATRAAALGKPVIDDPQSIIRCSNKVFLHELLRRERVATPKTLVAAPDTRFEEIEQALGLPFILKLPDGSFSTAVHKIGSKPEFRRLAGRMFRSSPLVIAQAWTPTEFDWRVTTLGGKPLFVCKYHMASGHWQIRSDTGRGVRYGRVEAVPREYAPQPVVRLACRASRLIGDGLYGVDLKETADGPVVIEVNDNPNLDVGYDDAADGDRVYEDLVDHFLAKVEGERRPRARKAPARAEPDPILAAIRRPIGPARPPEVRSGYRAYEVCGLELEYAVVDKDLNAASLVEPLLADLAGRPASDVVLGAVGFSNEIFDHVFEMKTVAPVPSLVTAEAHLSEAVRRVSAVLADRFDARLLPTGMHPWFDPRKARMWTRSEGKVYRTFERLFDTRTHGWANVQASHVNLPLGRDHEAAAMMTAAALLVPYLPAIAASTPMHDGDLQPHVDGRLAWILHHQGRVPESSGAMVPEYCESLAQYRRDVLAPLYAAVDRLPDASAIRHEFLNCRAAVFKLSRDSMEVRVLDMQECVKMDVAIAAFVRAALKAISRRLLAGEIERPDHAVLVEDFRATIRSGTQARVRAPHLTPSPALGPVRPVLEALVDMARETVRADEAPYLDLVARIARRGTLSERIAARLRPHLSDEHRFTDEARRVYVDLTECLRSNTPWE